MKDTHMHDEMTDAQVLALCKQRLPRAKETAAFTAVMLAYQYTTQGIPETDADGSVMLRPPMAKELKDIAQTLRWLEMPETAEKPTSDETIMDRIVKAGMRMPATVNVDTTEDAH
jgi:hypothetical protein